MRKRVSNFHATRLEEQKTKKKKILPKELKCNVEPRLIEMQGLECFYDFFSKQILSILIESDIILTKFCPSVDRIQLKQVLFFSSLQKGITNGHII